MRMSEIAKCPICSKDVKKSIWRPEYEGCAGNVIITVKCCGMEALTVELWNRYAAAMELVKVTKTLCATLDNCEVCANEQAISCYLRARDIVECLLKEAKSGHNL